MNKIVINSLQGFIDLIKKNPSLLNLEAFTGVKHFLTTLPDGGVSKGIKPKCGGGCKQKKALKQNKGIFESALTTLQPRDQAQMKTILNAREICYYTLGSGGKLDIHCF